MNDKELPSYRRPPVIEVVCGAQFGELASFSSVHYGKFWSRVAAEYPRTEEREPLAEIFEGAHVTQVKDEVVTLSIPPLRRVFYVSEDENYLLQVQSTRFHANWRRRRDEDQYPRFTAAKARFLNGWRQFNEFLRDENVDEPKVNQYELSYINHIFGTTALPEGIQDQLGCFTWRNAQTLKFLPAPSAVNLRLQFTLPEGKGTLRVTVNHGKRASDKADVMLMELTARGPGKNDAADMESWFSLAHEWIVTGFTDLTTAEAHSRWGREK